MKDLTKYYIDLSKLSEEEIKKVGRVFTEYGWNIWEDSLNELNQGILADYNYPFLVFNKRDNQWQHYNDDDNRTELTYPEFIKLFEGGEDYPNPTAQLQADKAELLEALEKAQNELSQFKESFGQGSKLIHEFESLIQKHKQ